MPFVFLHVPLFLSSLLDLQILLQKPGPSTSIWASARVQIRPKRHRMETVKNYGSHVLRNSEQQTEQLRASERNDRKFAYTCSKSAVIFLVVLRVPLLAVVRAYTFTFVQHFFSSAVTQTRHVRLPSPLPPLTHF